MTADSTAPAGPWSLVDELRARGLIEQITHAEELGALLADGPVTFYLGFDPTATSLHLGNLVPILAMMHLQRAGHRPIALVGGATGLIGDPSGRDTERSMLSADDVAKNVEAIGTQLRRLLSFDGPDGARMVNNYDWTAPMTFIEWLRDVGRHFSVNNMIAKDSVKRRLENREQGISYTEFSYQLLQAHDFLHLFRAHECRLQIGGNDQWGNIVAGTDLIGKVERKRAYGFTVPLLTTSTGDKFGKSAGNAVWLDPALTSPYQMYQWWLQTDDRDVGRWLRTFTFLPLAEIAEIEAAHMADPGRREGQRRLAAEVVRLLHGEAGLARALQATAVLFGATIENLEDDAVLEIFADVPATSVTREALVAGIPLLDLLVPALCKSRGEARKLVAARGFRLNNRVVEDDQLLVGPAQLASPSAMVLRSGKKTYVVVRVVG